MDNLEGDRVFQTYCQCVMDCDQYNIPTVVIHLPDDRHSINDLGMKRLEYIISLAEDRNVQVAFENLNNICNLDLVAAHI